MNPQEKQCLIAIVFIAGTLLGVVIVNLVQAYEKEAERERKEKERVLRDTMQKVASEFWQPRFDNLTHAIISLQNEMNRIREKNPAQGSRK